MIGEISINYFQAYFSHTYFKINLNLIINSKDDTIVNPIKKETKNTCQISAITISLIWKPIGIATSCPIIYSTASKTLIQTSWSLNVKLPKISTYQTILIKQSTEYINIEQTEHDRIAGRLYLSNNTISLWGSIYPVLCVFDWDLHKYFLDWKYMVWYYRNV